MKNEMPIGSAMLDDRGRAEADERRDSASNLRRRSRAYFQTASTDQVGGHRGHQHRPARARRPPARAGAPMARPAA